MTMPKTLTRAVLYARVSSENQDTSDKVSIQAQVESMTDLCKRLNWQIVETFVDNKRYIKTKPPRKGRVVEPSGKWDDRPGFLAMLAL